MSKHNNKTSHTQKITSSDDSTGTFELKIEECIYTKECILKNILYKIPKACLYSHLLHVMNPLN